MGGQQLVAYLLAIILPLLASGSHADEKSGWALSLGVGRSLIKDRDGIEDFRAYGFGYNWGPEYRFSKQWALGIDLFSMGRGRDTFNSVDTRIDVGGIELRARLIFPLSETVELYGRLGAAGYYTDSEPGRQNLGEDAVTFGLGLDIDRGEHFTIRIDGRHFQGPRDESGALLTAGFNYRF